MDILIKDTLKFIKEELPLHEMLLASSEDFAHFQKKKEIVMTEETPSKFVLEPVSLPHKEEMTETRNLVSKVAPELSLVSQIPSDDRAKKIANLWKEDLNTAEVILLSYGQTAEELKFLQNVAQAVHALGAPTKLIDASRFEKEGKWPLFFSSFSLKLILVPDMNLWKKTTLSTFYKENPTQGLHFLGETPLLILHPVSHYLKNPTLKKLLWKTIVSHLSS